MVANEILDLIDNETIVTSEYILKIFTCNYFTSHMVKMDQDALNYQDHILLSLIKNTFDSVNWRDDYTSEFINEILTYDITTDIHEVGN